MTAAVSKISPLKGRTYSKHQTSHKQFHFICEWVERQDLSHPITRAELCRRAALDLGHPVPDTAMDTALEVCEKVLLKPHAKPAKLAAQAVIARTLVALMRKLSEPVDADLLAVAKLD